MDTEQQQEKQQEYLQEPISILMKAGKKSSPGLGNIHSLAQSNPSSDKPKNRGTGAGGANTNVTGKSFEQKTENETRLLANGFVRKQIPGCKNNSESSFYLIKETGPTESIVYLTQYGLVKYFKHFFKKEMCRRPDEAYLFRNGDKYTLKVLEKKNQNMSGSVDTKLLAGIGFIKVYEYHIKNENFTVRYAFCISDFLKKDYISEKSEALRHINQTYGIAVLFGDDPNYYETLDVWVNS